jgi:hypothetical protein
MGRIFQNGKLYLKGKVQGSIFSIKKDEDYLQNIDKKAKVNDLEKQIDQLVCKLYGLTEDEIAIVEGNNHFKMISKRFSCLDK